MDKKSVIKILKGMRPKKYAVENFNIEMKTSKKIEWAQKVQMNHERKIYDHMIERLENCGEDYSWIDDIKIQE